MRIIDEYKTTGNPTVWKRLRKHVLQNKGLINCTWCRYHSGENRQRKVPQYAHWQYNRGAL